jgi:hypothetical protein
MSPERNTWQNNVGGPKSGRLLKVEFDKNNQASTSITTTEYDRAVNKQRNMAKNPTTRTQLWQVRFV